MTLPFDRLVHSDWSGSENGRGRIRAAADWEDGNWHVSEPVPVGDPDAFVDSLCDTSRTTLAGFDFPIGLPRAYAARAGIGAFRSALPEFGTGAWEDFFRPCDRIDEVSLHRPFFPRGSHKGEARRPHAKRLGVSGHDLLRRVERAIEGNRPAAACLFFTLGPAQVGKAALHGWRTVLRPALSRGARLWPFDGTLASLAAPGAPTLAETYPGEAYRHVGIDFRRDGRHLGKGDREARIHACAGVATPAAARRIHLAPALSHALADGFGTARGGDDRLDALAGLLHMIEVASGRLPESPPDIDRAIEGWILGQPE